MKKRQKFSISILLLIAVFLLFANSCKKDDDNNSSIPVLSTSEVTKIGQITAQSGGVITSDAGFAVTERGVCWNTTGNPSISDTKTSDGLGAGSFTSKLTGLTLGKMYYLRAYATNNKGTAYGSTMVFETLGNTFTDSRDGNIYKIVTIGNQVWMAENLRYLPSVVGPETNSTTIPYHYVYEYDGTSITTAKATANYTTYGVLYNWEALKTAAPEGWHIPTDLEWTQLTTYLDGENIASGKLKETGTSHWNSPNTGATNETGFSALPGGYYDAHSMSFRDINNKGNWWSAIEGNEIYIWMRNITYKSTSVNKFRASQVNVFSIRCVKD